MINWSDVAVTQERYKDFLREADQDRLIQQAHLAHGDSGVWQKVKGLFAGAGKNESAEDTRSLCSVQASR